MPPRELSRIEIGVFSYGVFESPRELRRLHYLREWSHDEQIKQIFP
jgi:hypothetical protein